MRFQQKIPMISLSNPSEICYNTTQKGGGSLEHKADFLCNSILLLCAIAAAMIATVMGVSALGQTGSAAAAVLCLLFWMLGSMALLRKSPFPAHEDTLWAVMILYLALCLRLIFLNHISPDYVSFLSKWVETMRSMTPRQALATPIGDYNMPYLYFLLLVSRLPMYDLYAIKLLSILADVFAALAVVKLTGLFTRNTAKLLLAFSGALLAPTLLLNGSYWGQCDSVYGALALWGLYFGLTQRPLLCLSLLALSFAFKLQAVFLLPIVIFLLVMGELKLKHLPIFPAVFFAMMLPALLAGRSVSDTFSIYFSQAGAYPYLSLNAPSFWVMVPNDYFNELTPGPVLFAGIGVLALLFLFLKGHITLRKTDLLDLSLIFCLMIPYLLPKMHERYFYLAEILSLVYWARFPKRWPVTLVILLGGFLSYRSYLFGGEAILTNAQMAIAYGAVLCYLIYTAGRRVLLPADSGHARKE